MHGQPSNFGWIISGWLSASGLPNSSMSLRWLRGVGVELVINLCKESAPDQRMYLQSGLELYYCPVADYSSPSCEQAKEVVSKISLSIKDKKPVHICCRYGVGRSPTVAAIYLVSQGMSPEEAIDWVAGRRNGKGYGNWSEHQAIYKLAPKLFPGHGGLGGDAL